MRTITAITTAMGLIFGATASAGAVPPKAHHKTAQSVRPIPTSGILSSSDLLAVAIVALRVHKDSFSTDPNARLIGRRFRFVQGVKESGVNDATVDGNWSYDKEAATISFSLAPTDYHVMFNSRAAGSFIGQNGFGVKFRVAVRRATEVVVSPNAESVLLNPYSNLTSVVPADSRKGRALSQTVVLVIEGSITAPGGTVASCDTDDNKATIDDPTDEITTKCTINAKVDHLAFEDTATGAILAEAGTAPKPDPH